MRHILTVLAVVAAMVAAGCGRRAGVSPELARVEAIYFESPESALTILAQIDTAALRSDADRAAYYLYSTIAKDKTFRNIEADTMIAFSADYYHSTGQTHNEMLANCYYSRVKFENGEFAKSVILAMKARELAAQNSEPFYEALALRNISDIYVANYHFSEGLKYSMEAYEKFCEAEVQPYINYALHDVASDLIATGKARYSIPWISKAVDSAVIYGDSVLMIESKRLLAKAYYALEDYEKAVELYHGLLQGCFPIREDSLYLGAIYVRQDRLDLARDLIFASPLTSDYLDRSVRKDYYTKLGGLDSLNAALRDFSKVAIATINSQTENEIPGVIADYFLLEKQIDRERHEVERLRNLLFVIALLIVLVAVVIFAVRSVRRQRRAIEANVALAMQMQEDLLRQAHSHDEYSSKVKGLLSTKYTLLDQLSQIAFESTTSVAARRRMSDTVAGLIKELSQEESPRNKELAEFVDQAFDNIYTHFRADFPNLRQGEYNLFVYSVLGFSGSTISVFLGEKTVSSVYERKRRLRNKIKNSTAARKDEYLEWLGQRIVN